LRTRVYGSQREILINRGTWVPRSKDTTLSQDPTVALCLGSYGGPREGVLMSEVPLYKKCGVLDASAYCVAELLGS